MERKEIVVPSGWDVIEQLPNDLANEYLEDEAICGLYGNKSYLIAAMDALAMGAEKEACRILRACRASAGESENAISDWIRLYGDEQ